VKGWSSLNRGRRPPDRAGSESVVAFRHPRGWILTVPDRLCGLDGALESVRASAVNTLSNSRRRSIQVLRKRKPGVRSAPCNSTGITGKARPSFSSRACRSSANHILRFCHPPSSQPIKTATPSTALRACSSACGQARPDTRCHGQEK
jgi:hypothetical protein